MTLDDIEAALWHSGAAKADVITILAMVADYTAEASEAAVEHGVAAWRRAELASANGLVTHRSDGDVLRAAHTEAARLRVNGLPVPGRLAALDRQYERDRKRAQRELRRAS